MMQKNIPLPPLLATLGERLERLYQLHPTACQFAPESRDYEAAVIHLNELPFLYRTAKITPKKKGQFVTCWKRNAEGKTAPYHEADAITVF